MSEGGKIYKHRPQSVELLVQSINDLTILINHFYKYPLKTQKKSDFELIKKAFYLISQKEHLTNEGLLKIVAIKASMNLGLSDDLKVAFPNIIPQERPLVETKTIDNPDWLAGFTSAEGCFFVYIRASKTHSIGFQVILVFGVTQHSRDEKLMKSLIKYLECGYINKAKTRPNEVNFIVTKFWDITKNIIPFFPSCKTWKGLAGRKKHPIQGGEGSRFCWLM